MRLSRALLWSLVLSPSLALGQNPAERLEQLAADYGIEFQVVRSPISFQRLGYTVSARPVTDDVLAKYVPILEREWRRYPRTLMIRMKLGKVVVGADVRVLGQPRAAVPEFIPGWFWLDAAVGSRLPAYGRHSLHHDLFHMLDYWDSPDHLKDEAWAALNPSGTKYGNGGWSMQKGNPGALTDKVPGFLTMYSTSGVEEDKAEVYSHLITSRDIVSARRTADPIVDAKVRRVMELVDAFEPFMDKEWFLRNGSDERT